MENFIKISKALSDASRVKILKLIEDTELCVCEIQSVFDVSQPTISKHLKVLESAGLVSSTKKGMWVYYRLNKQNDSVYSQVLLNAVKGWFNDDSDIIEAKKNIKNICKVETSK